MKKTVAYIISFIAFVLCSCISNKSIVSNVIVDFHSFKGQVYEMIPFKYPPRSVSNDYGIEIRNDSAIVYLPYTGEVYTPMLNDEGLNFSAPIRNMKTIRNKANTATVAVFSVTKGMIKYEFRVTAYDRGTFDLDVRPSNAQACSYNGHVSLD